MSSGPFIWATGAVRSRRMISPAPWPRKEKCDARRNPLHYSFFEDGEVAQNAIFRDVENENPLSREGVRSCKLAGRA